MKFLDPIRNMLSLFWRWLRTFPHLGSLALVIGAVTMMVFQMMGYHEGRLPWMPANGMELAEAKDWPMPSQRLLAFYYLMPYLKLWALIGGVVYHIALIRSVPDVERLVWPTWIACGFLAIWGVCSDLHDQLEFARLSVMGEPVSMASYAMKLVMITMVCLTPAIGLSYYVSAKLLDRYTFRSFLQPLLFCFVGICLLWIMWDLLDSLKDFQEAGATGKIVSFYLGLVPYIYVETMWAVLLLATLFTLMRMSRANELISMLGAGRSLMQILRPIFVLAGLISVVGMAANYYWAPRAEGNRQAVMRALSSDEEGAIATESFMYRDEPGRRTWYIGGFPFTLRNDRIRHVEVFQDDEKGRRVRSIRSPSVTWRPDGTWIFYRALEMTYDAKGDPMPHINRMTDGSMGRIDVADWPETPWSIISSSLTPDYMSVQELVSYLKAHGALASEKLAAFRVHFFHRFSYPWLCFIAALVAAPLGISFSRRGVLGGVAGAIFFLGALLFLKQFFLSLGKGLHLAPWLCVWMPHIILAAAGLFLLHYRSINRDIPMPSLRWLTDRTKTKRRATTARTAA